MKSGGTLNVVKDSLLYALKKHFSITLIWKDRSGLDVSQKFTCPTFNADYVWFRRQLSKNPFAQLAILFFPGQSGCGICHG